LNLTKFWDIAKGPKTRKLMKSVSEQQDPVRNLAALDAKILGFKNNQVFES